MAIPFFSIDLSSSEWSAYAAGAVGAGWTGSGAVQDLTVQLAQRFPQHHVTLLPSARLGFYLLLSTSFQPDDEIIFPAMGFPLYVKIASQLGLVPVLVDVERDHLTIDPGQIRAAVTSRTKAIVVTHLFGHPAQMAALTDIATTLGIPLIEDSAQSFDSFFAGSETGTFGWAGIFSCSLMKVPTTLGGGILVTRDRALHERVQQALEVIVSDHAGRAVKYHAKGFVSMLNSMPALYTAFSHQAFGLIKHRNPALLRSILYSGMGMQHVTYDPRERPGLARYQLNVGAVQFARTRDMTETRRRHSATLDAAVADLPHVTRFAEARDCYWNYQYHVVDLGRAMHQVFDALFARGIHAMKEDVWDCTAYRLRNVRHGDCAVASSRNPGLLRIPNNSYISGARMRAIAAALRDACVAAA